jgi:hypothetical protein
MIRPATGADIEQIIEIAIKVLTDADQPGMTVNRLKVSTVVRRAIQSKRNFVWVSATDGQVTGIIAATIDPDLFHDGYQANVLMWWGTEGIELMRALVAWADAQDSVIMTCYSWQEGADERIRLLLKRLGFTGTDLFIRMRKLP